MAIPSITYYGATVDLLQKQFFPSGFPSQPDQDLAQAAIDDIAGEVELRIRAFKMEPKDISAAHSPLAYRWLQNTVLVGAAARYALNQGRDVAPWRDEWRDRLTTLELRPAMVLTDVPRPESVNSGGSYFNPR